jgi:thioredoxin 1
MAAPTAPGEVQALPRLLDLGAHACVPCKRMAPILDDLRTHYADAFTTEFIDVWQNPEPAQLHGIRAIPTQIFFDAEGKERFRHEGFFAKEDILATWRELGVAIPDEGE